MFLEVSLPDDYKDDEKDRFHSGQGGALQPVMCVDKSLEELDSFYDLVKESEEMAPGWQLVLVASLSGKNGLVPDPVEVERSLQMMVETVQHGGDLSKFMAFDRSGEPVRFD